MGTSDTTEVTKGIHKDLASYRKLSSQLWRRCRKETTGEDVTAGSVHCTTQVFTPPESTEEVRDNRKDFIEMGLGVPDQRKE